MSTTFSAAIFDLDGTLIESNSVWEKLDRMILARRGLSCSDEFITDLTAMSYEDAAAAMQNIGINISTEEFMREINELAVIEYGSNIFLKDGAFEYLNYLKNNNIKTALATASPRELYKPVLEHNGVYSLFDAFVTTDEAGAGKDSPAVYLLAAQKLGIAPQMCAVFEDIPKGIVSAKAAGMYAVGVYDKYSEKYIDEIKGTADRFIYSFTEMIL
ncbi:MAG: HAD family hydrolase [Oscillospiraceae bacterium]